MIRRCYLFRHGMTGMNERRCYCGATDVPLSGLGRRLLLQNKSEFLYPDISSCRIVTSGMRRTEETLSLLYGALPHSADSRLQEMHFGSFEGFSYGELKERADYRRWIGGDTMADACPCGESGSQMQRRVLAAFHELLALPGSDIALFVHGGPVAAIMQELFPSEKRNLYEWQPDFGCGYELEFCGGACSYRGIPAARSGEGAYV